MNRFLKYQTNFFFALLLAVMIFGGARGTFGQNTTVSVPLYELPGRKMSMPVSLIYNTKGIKVDQLASNFGMGWDLIAGGSIQRVVRGIPDDKSPTPYSTGGFCHNSSSTLNSTDPIDFKDIAYDRLDGEPDLFYYQFPGHSGSFVVTNEGFHTIPYDAVDIVSNFCSEEGTWIITAANGMQYIFGELIDRDGLPNLSRELSHDKYYREDNLGKEYEYISSWHLTSIIGPDGVLEFELIYDQNDPGYSHELNSKIYNKLLSSECTGNTDFWVDLKHESTIKESVIKKIIGPIGRMLFEYSPTQREDLPNAYALDKIEIVNSDDQSIFQYEFFTNYGLSLQSPKEIAPVAYCATAECKRLYLDRIDKVSGGQRIQYRSFDYFNRDNLPRRDSGFKDHWGYPNVNSTYDAGDYNVPIASMDESLYGTTDKNAFDAISNVVYHNGMLKSITLQSAGIVNYSYERNFGKVIRGASIIGSASLSIGDELPFDQGPGLRLSETRFVSGSSPDLVTTYNYRGGYFAKPSYVTKYTKIAGEEISIPLPVALGPLLVSVSINTSCASEFISISEEPMSPGNDLFGGEMGYEEIEEIRSDGSKALYSYTGHDDHPDLLPEAQTAYDVSGGGIPIMSFSEADPTAAPFSALSYRGWKRGRLKSIEVFNSSGNRIARTSYGYNFSTTEKIQITAMCINTRYTNIYDISTYNLISQPLYMITREEWLADMDEPWDRMASLTSYEYEQEHNQLISETTTGSDGSVYKMTYRYPFDFELSANLVDGDPESRAIARLISKNINAVPLEVVQYKDDKVISASLSTYGLFNANVDQVYPYKTYALQTNEPLDVGSGSEVFTPIAIDAFNYFSIDNHYGIAQSTISAYDAYGNPTSVSDNGLTNTSITYDPETHSLITSQSTNGVTTTYTYKPLVGVLTETDRNGQKIEYEYDVFGRLEWIKDHKGNYLQRYEYSYVNEH